MSRCHDEDHDHDHVITDTSSHHIEPPRHLLYLQRTIGSPHSDHHIPPTTPSQLDAFISFAVDVYSVFTSDRIDIIL